MTKSWSRTNWPILAQGLLAIGAIGLMAMMPPRAGAMLIISLKGESRGDIARWAIQHDARLVGAGPWANALVVSGARAALAESALEHGAIIVSATAAGCAERSVA